MSEMIKSTLRRRMDKLSTKMLFTRATAAVHKVIRIHSYLMHESWWNDRPDDQMDMINKLLEYYNNFMRDEIVRKNVDSEMVRWKREKKRYESRNKGD